MPKALSGLMGMRHIALNVKDVERSKAFYQDDPGHGRRVAARPPERLPQLRNG